MVRSEPGRVRTRAHHAGGGPDSGTGGSVGRGRWGQGRQGGTPAAASSSDCTTVETRGQRSDTHQLDSQQEVTPPT